MATIFVQFLFYRLDPAWRRLREEERACRSSEFADAVEKFLARESEGIERYVDELNERSPFRTRN